MTPETHTTRPELASEVVKRCALSTDALRLLQPDEAPQPFFARLVREELLTDAVQFAAYYLTPREAIWWGCLCLWQVYRTAPPKRETEVLNAVARWVVEPDDARRLAARAMGQASGNNTLASNLARAVFYSGDSIAPPGQPRVAPPEGQVAHCVAAAVMLASKTISYELSEACLVHFLELAGQVSRGEASWQAEELRLPTPPDDGELQHA